MDFESRVTDSLARLETNMQTLVGDSGRVTKLEEKVGDLEKLAWRLGGIILAAGGIMHTIIDTVLPKLFGGGK